MRSELLADLLTIARGRSSQKPPATAVTPVTALSGYRSKPPELQALHRLQTKNSKLEKGAFQPETMPETGLPESVQDAIEERAALCAGCVPAIYLDAWARLNHQKPVRVSDADWYRAVNDGGLFLDRWGSEAALWGWTAGDLLDVPRDGQRGGLIWFLAGERVEACGPEHAQTESGLVFDRPRRAVGPYWPERRSLHHQI
jgi:hypothetical protein